MATVKLTIVGKEFNPTAANPAAGHPVVIVGEAFLTDVGVGGGPMPPDSGAHPEHPIYWPPGTQPHPEHPIVYPPTGKPPGIWGGGNEGFPTPPIVIPPPDFKPPAGFTPPPAGSTAPIGGEQPVNPINVPEYILVNYPGYGWIAVGKPVSPPSTSPTATATKKA